MATNLTGQLAPALDTQHPTPDTALDPITLSVIQNGLQAVAAEMDLTFMRTAFSPVISESFDRSDGVYDRHTGEVICQGALGLPIFMGVMQFTTQSVISRCPDLEPSDVILINDPYLGGTHLMDVKMVQPFFYHGRLFAYLANTGHWPDTGGRVPGGFTARATEIQQEGLRLPPVRFVRRGELDQDILDIVLANVRVPEERIGDIQAQLGALAVGERRLTALLDRYGADTVEAAIGALKDRSERLMRAHIATIPNGVYESEAFIDSDAIDPEPLAIRLTLTVSDTDLTFDFSGSSPPCRGPLNSVLAATKSSVYIAVKHVFPDVPINAGCFAPLHIPDPEGTFLYAKYPRPVNGCSAEVTQRVIESVFLALAQAIPDRLWAAPAGTSGNYTLGGADSDARRRYIMYVFSGGGYGGSFDGDGLTNGCSAIGISKIPPVEVCEQRYPVLFEEYALREGSAGAGRHRGGFGVSYRTRLIRGDGVASFMMDHGRFGPPGVLGGQTGAPNEIVVGRDGQEFRPVHWSKDEDIALRPGDWVQVRTPGGGGYGNPLERDPMLVLRDVRRGYLTAAEAAEQYRVVVRESNGDYRTANRTNSVDLDETATVALRAQSLASSRTQ
jgi:N-methylhydantoinase B